MSTTSIKRQFEEAKEQAAAIIATAKHEERPLTPEEDQRLTEFMQTATAKKSEMGKAIEDQKKMEAVDALGEIGFPKDDGKSYAPAGKTIGERFTESREFKNFLRQYPDGRVPEQAKGVMSHPVAFRGYKDLVTGASDTSAGALVQSDWRGLVDGTGTLQRPLSIRDVITVGQTGSDLVEYAKISAFTNNAAPVAEATATSGSSGLKPESALTTVRETAAVKTIAHWIPVTKRALADAAQIRTVLDGWLRFGLEEELEDQIVQGDGSGENFTGIANVSGTQSQAWDTDVLTTTRKARTKVMTVGRARATAWLLNPAQVEEVELQQAATGNYFFGGPGAAGTANTLWGVPVVESEAVPAGVGYVGDFRQCVLWDREQATIQVSDSPGDQFIRNMVTILAELRAAFGIVRPAAIVEVDLSA